MFSMVAGGATLDVIVVADAVWIRQDGSDEWLASTQAPASDPLAAARGAARRWLGR